MRRVLACLLWLLMAAPAAAQVPGGNEIAINITPVIGGTATQCLYVTSSNKVGNQACGAGTAANIQVGTTTVGGGTTTRVLYDNAGVLGEYTITGTGSVVMSAAPTITGTATFSGVIGAAVGTVAAPALVFSGDEGTGWYRRAANTWSYSVSGSLRFELGANFVRFNSAGLYAWTAGAASAAADTNFNRAAAGIVGVGAGTGATLDGGISLSYVYSNRVTAPGTPSVAGQGVMYLDTADDRLKVKFSTGNVVALAAPNGTTISNGYTVATLPATPATGARAHVTDALNAAACAFNTVIVAGGTTACPVFYNGVAWVGG